MVLRTVHVAERQLHHLVDDFNGIFRRFHQTEADDGVHPRRVAFRADVMAVNAAGLAVLLLVAYHAFHQRVLFKILQRRPANQTFFVVHNLIFVAKIQKTRYG